MENDVPMTNVMDLVEDDLYNPLAIDLLEAVRQLQRIIPAENRLLDTKILDEYTFNSESVTKTAVLDKLSQCLLAPPYTLPMISVFRPIVIDLVARWLTPGFTNFLETDNNAVQKIELAAKAFSVILPVVPQVKSLAVRYFQNSPSLFERLNHLPNAESMETIKNKMSEELLSLLLTAYRLLNFSTSTFIPLWNWGPLVRLLNHPDTTVRYMAVLCLSKVYSLSDAQTKGLLSSVTGSDPSLDRQDEPVLATIDGTQIDLRMLELWEAQKLAESQISLVHNNNSNSSSQHQHNLADTDLCPLTCNLCGVLMPKSSNDTSQRQEPHLILTDTTKRNLHTLSLALSIGAPTFLEGVTGSGKTSLVEELARLTGRGDDLIKIHLGDQTDPKVLLGTYVSTSTPGSFRWQPGVLTTAVQEGRWVLIEDIDLAPAEVVSVLLPLLETRHLFIPSRGEKIKAKEGFQLFGTRSLVPSRSGKAPSSRGGNEIVTGANLWTRVHTEPLSTQELEKVIREKFPSIGDFAPHVMQLFQAVTSIYQDPNFSSLSSSTMGRYVSTRDLMKWCHRINNLLGNRLSGEALSNGLDMSVREDIFGEAIDSFCGMIPDQATWLMVLKKIGEPLQLLPGEVENYVTQRTPALHQSENRLSIGRVNLSLRPAKGKALRTDGIGKGSGKRPFAKTRHALRLLEKIAVCVHLNEPTLLVGETGTGKTTVVQQLADMLHQNLIVVNLSQQSDSSDLLGGFKPVEGKILAIPLKEEFDSLFEKTFSVKKNAKFLDVVRKTFVHKKWKNFVAILQQTVKMAQRKFEGEQSNDGSNKKTSSPELRSAWKAFEKRLREFEVQQAQAENNFVFNFMEGSLVKAVKQGDWILLDEINLATTETLECLSGLLQDAEGSLLLTEKGDVEPIKRHPNFRLFACMNPATDVGKRDLPPGLRNRFTEFYVHPPDANDEDRLQIVSQYIGKIAVGDGQAIHDVADFYAEAKKLSLEHVLVDGANQKPHFSLRTLSRALTYTNQVYPTFGLRRSLYEGLCMTFLTQLNKDSEAIMRKVIFKHILKTVKNPTHFLSQVVKSPGENFIQFGHFWLEQGQFEPQDDGQYIMTKSVEANLYNLARVIMSRKFPVLIQGPTSAGKTSMIEYLAKKTGHRFVRINNHEHTDLQEYLGTYVSNNDGKLVFQEGVLVEALRNGYWIVLDELNLAPSDVLEALNRLLDDNRELLIPETQEVVKPHPHFMLFATQNPAGLYGGRKALSRAFRNRFLELHFDDIPQDELETILSKRCQIAPSYCTKIVQVYKSLMAHRKSTRIFEQKNSFITLRDLFRWAGRDPNGYQELAEHGYMLLAERCRKDEEKKVVKSVLETVMKVKLNEDEIYDCTKLEEYAIYDRILKEKAEKSGQDTKLVWTKAMRRLFSLVAQCLRYREPVLLVGETGCGKTTVCQMLAETFGRELHIVNCHQNTETGDLLGGQRPVRNRLSSTNDDQQQQQLFEWHDGPLVQAMREGHLFLLDEISLADDSVLERLNSVLEPSRLLVLAEKGGKNVEELTAKDGFQFLATMNPGGDYGKKELSPALRNRFTEIWVPSVTDREDLTAIIDEQLTVHPKLKGYGTRMLDFIEWFMHALSQTHTIVSLRDILSWVRFMNVAVSKNLDPELAFAHGGCLVLLDGLGSHGASGSFLAGDALKEFRIKCLRQLTNKPEATSETDILATANETANISDHNFAIGPFYIERGPLDKVDIKFTLLAPTTADNAMRVIRAMQLQKPILLEGSPGVGKTSLISALAAASGHRLLRINLSEQTDLMDLFGSDLPVEGGDSGEFAWRDAPFLQAMKAGDWVLLDELNLASQSVLEGLNSCLDHRGAVYIPELDREFFCAKGFRVFGAQNPLQQGGGRKGLPKSFVNRFTQVYVEHLSAEDLLFICAHLFPEFDPETLKKMIDFNTQMYHETMVLCRFGRKGSPWEFNLRDVFRWLELMKKDSVQDPAEHLGTIYLQRMRTQEDREKVVELFEKVFGCKYTRSAYPAYKVTADVLKVGHSQLPRRLHCAATHDSKTHLLHTFLAPLEALMKCVESSWMAIVTGPSASGKTSMVRLLSKMTGNRLHEFAMNNSVDTMELLGGFEQVDLNRHRHVAVEAFEDLISRITRALLMHMTAMPTDQQWTVSERIRQLNDAWFTIKNQRQMAKEEEAGLDYTLLYSIVDGLRKAAQLADNDALPLIDSAVVMVQNLQKLEQTSVAGKFEWIDGLLINALEHGHWLLIDNANLCNPSVLDRLNPLFENDGVLMVNERGLVDGQVKIIKPHPNFRMFMTVDPANGELSRAMRNRGIEIALVNSMWNDNEQDVTKLANSMGIRGAELPILLNTMQKDAVQKNHRAARNKSVREFIMLATYVVERLQRGQPLKAALRDSFHQVFVDADSIPESLATLLDSDATETDIRTKMLAPSNCPILVSGSMFENDSALATVALQGSYLLYLLQQPQSSSQDIHYARSLEVAGDYLLETLSLCDVGLRRRWLAFVGQHANVLDSAAVKRLLQLLKAVSEHPAFVEWTHIKDSNDQQAIERSRQAMIVVIRLCKLNYADAAMRNASKNLKFRNMSALQQAYAFSEARLNEAQLMHPIVKSILAIFDSVRTGLRQWIQNEEYKKCAEEDFVTLHKILDARDFAWTIAESSTLSLDNFVNILRVIQQLVSNNESFAVFGPTVELVDRSMQGFDFETCKSMKALWKYFGPATLSSESLHAIEMELCKLNESLDSYRSENADQGLQPNSLIMKAKADLKETLIEGVATLYAVDKKDNKEALKLAKSLQHLPEHVKRQVDVLSEETHRTPTPWDTALVPLFDYSNLSAEMEILAHLYLLCCAQGATTTNGELLEAIKKFRSFFVSNTCRPPLDIVPYQRLLWMLDAELSSLDIVSIPGIAQDAAHAWHKRLWRSSINQQSLFQLTSSLKPKTFGIVNGSQMLYQNVETVACLNIIGSVDAMSAVAYEDALKQLKSLKQFLATHVALKDKKTLEIVAVIGTARQIFDASRELINNELSQMIMERFHHLDSFVACLFQQDMYTVDTMYPEFDGILSILPNMESILTEHKFNSYYVSAISAIKDALLHYRSKNHASFFVAIGKARVYLGLCFVSAYVPDYPVDPTAEPRLRVNLLVNKKESLEDSIKTRQNIEKLITGGSSNVFIAQEQALVTEIDQELSRSSTVFSRRPQKSQLEDIFVDLTYVQKHLLSSNVESLIKDIEAGNKNASQREELLQGNAQQFIERMHAKYPLYRDMLQPLLVAMDAVKYGLRIMVTNIHSERADVFLSDVVELFVRNPSIARFPDMDWHQMAETVQLTKLRAIVFERYPASRKWAFYLGLLLVILQRLYSVINAHGYLRLEDLTALNTLFEEIVQVWKGAQDYKREKEEEKERLFKVRQKKQDPMTEEELEEEDMKKTFADFNEMFADLEEREDDDAPVVDNVQVEEGSVLRDGDVQLIGELHKAIFDNFETRSCQRNADPRERSILRAYIAAGQLATLTTTAFSDAVDYVCNAGHLNATNICIQRLEAQNSFSTQSDDIYDFYKSENVAEVKLVQPVILRFKSRVEHLQQEWPEHAILQQLIVICDKILGFSIVSPVAKFLTGIEILLQKSEDWEAYAAKHVSLSAQREELTSLIVRWRQLELNCWPKLLDAQEQYGSNAAYVWWFHLYDVVNNTNLENGTEEELTERRRELLAALDHFMQSAPLVEYEPRLKMLDSFFRQAKVQSEWSNQYKAVSTIMRNVYMYYSQFRDHVELMKSQLRKPIEKDLKDFVKIASWKDVNIYALRQSAQKTHRQLHKCIRKYREVLNTSMLTVIANYNQEHAMFQYGDEKRYNDTSIGFLDQLGRADLWIAESSVPALAFDWPMDAAPIKRHLEDLPGTLAKMQRYCRQDLMVFDNKEGLPLESMMTEMIQQIKHFQRETPVIMTDENKSLVKNQKLLKKKALVDFLKELRRLGLRSRPGTLAEQNANTAYIFSQHVAALDEALQNRGLQKDVLSSYSAASQEILDLWSKANDYYFRSVARISHLRTLSTTQVSKDLSMLEVERSMSATEHMFSLITKERTLATRIERRIQLLQGASVQLAATLQDKPSASEAVTRLSQRLVAHKLFMDDLVIMLTDASKTLDIQAEYVPSAKSMLQAMKDLCDQARKLRSKTDQCFVQRYLSASQSKPLLTSPVGKMMDSHETIVQGMAEDLSDIVAQVPQMTHTVQAILKHIKQHQQAFAQNGNQDPQQKQQQQQQWTMVDLRDKVYSLIDAILVAVQDLKKAKAKPDVQLEEGQEMADDYIKDQHAHQFTVMNALHMDIVSRRCVESLDIAHDLLATHASDVCGLLQQLYPFLQQYMLLAQHSVGEFLLHHKSMAKLTYALINSFSIIISKGFCMPQGADDEGEEGEAEGTVAGTGIGEGEGTKDVSEEIEDEEQVLGTQNEEPQPKSDKKDTKEEKKGIEMENDFEGELEDIEHDENEDEQKDQDEEEEEEEEQNLDDEIGDVDDMDPDAVDDKMWGDDENHEQRKDTDKTVDQQGQSEQQESDIVAKEEEDTAQPQQQQKPESKGEQPEASEEQPQNQQEEEQAQEEDEGEGEDEAENGLGQQMNVEVPEAETLELPEDLEMDGDEEGQEGDQGEEEQFYDAMDMDEDQQVGETEEEGQEAFQDPLDQIGQGEQDTEEKQEDEEMADAAAQVEGEQQADEKEKQEGKDGEEANKEQQDAEQEAQGDTQQQGQVDIDQEDQDAEQDNKTQGREHAGNEDNIADNQFGVQGQAGKQSMSTAGEQQGENEQSESADTLDKRSETQDKQGVSERGANQANEDAEAEQEEEKKSEQQKSNPQRSLGDALESWRRRLADVADAEEEEDEEQEAEESQGAAKDDEKELQVNEDNAFEYVKNDEDAHDMQTMGNAAKDQVQDINMAAMDETTQDEENYAGEMDIDEKPTEDIDTMPLPRDAMDVDGQQDGRGAILSRRLPDTNLPEDGEMLTMDESLVAHQPLDQEDIERMRQELETTVSEWREEGRDSQQARELWQRYENLTHDLAMGLCEQLRLILEPTLATKLKGDYRTGKRLNMKKIIPYIASQFKKDKIWLRRTKPSKRQYQVMISVDDSKSMSESRSVQLAYEALSLISKALSQLEVGDLSITSFGERIRILHPFDQPFTAESGASVLQQFTFAQEQTKVKELIETSLSLFENAKSSSQQELWQLQLIISDGICNNHDVLQQLVRKAMDQQVMIIFIIVDNKKEEKDSILKMQQVSYSTVNGSMKIEWKPYLETFPFQYFMVLRDINALPEALSDALRQYFSFVSAS